AVGTDDIPAFLGDAALGALLPRASSFLGIAETQALLDEVEAGAPALVRQTVPKPVSLPVYAEVLRRLLEERLSIRDQRTILEALAAIGGVEKDPLNLAEFVRAQLRRSITHRLAGSARELPVLVLDSPLEETIRGALQRTPAGTFLALAPAVARDIVSSVRNALQSWPAPSRPVLLAQPDIRRFVRKLLEVEFPELEIVSPVELMPTLQLRAVARAVPN
ncbi:MAG: flagellar biosynthesis protein FlhA, partial [Myxococcota bacterium]|nr:flagellar biosynthesis protein FlhA [Myxococcota bacterium]